MRPQPTPTRRPRGPGGRGAMLYAELCGATLARAYACWRDRIATATYLGKGDAFDPALAAFAAVYAERVCRSIGL